MLKVQFKGIRRTMDLKVPIVIQQITTIKIPFPLDPKTKSWGYYQVIEFSNTAISTPDKYYMKIRYAER